MKKSLVLHQTYINSVLKYIRRSLRDRLISNTYRIRGRLNKAYINIFYKIYIYKVDIYINFINMNIKYTLNIICVYII